MRKRVTKRRHVTEAHPPDVIGVVDERLYPVRVDTPVAHGHQASPRAFDEVLPITGFHLIHLHPDERLDGDVQSWVLKRWFPEDVEPLQLGITQFDDCFSERAVEEEENLLGFLVLLLLHRRVEGLGVETLPDQPEAVLVAQGRQVVVVVALRVPANAADVVRVDVGRQLANVALKRSPADANARAPVRRPHPGRRRRLGRRRGNVLAERVAGDDLQLGLLRQVEQFLLPLEDLGLFSSAEQAADGRDAYAPFYPRVWVY